MPLLATELNRALGIRVGIGPHAGAALRIVRLDVLVERGGAGDAVATADA